MSSFRMQAVGSPEKVVAHYLILAAVAIFQIGIVIFVALIVAGFVLAIDHNPELDGAVAISVFCLFFLLALCLLAYTLWVFLLMIRRSRFFLRAWTWQTIAPIIWIFAAPFGLEGKAVAIGVVLSFAVYLNRAKQATMTFAR